MTLNKGKNIKYLPYAFTEQGSIMAATVLSSTCAVERSLFVVRAFVWIRAIFLGSKELAEQLVRLIKN